MKKFKNILSAFSKLILNPLQIKAYAALFIFTWRAKGLKVAILKTFFVLKSLTPVATHILDQDYRKWLCQNNDKNYLHDAKEQQKSLNHQPLISILLISHQSNPDLLQKTIVSVLNQVYLNWELCIVADGSGPTELKQLLQEYAEKNSKIKIKIQAKNLGHAKSIDAALTLAQGEFTAFLNQHDELSPLALFFVANEISKFPTTDLIYSDEDQIDINQQRYNPFLKPDWDPYLLYSYNYIKHFCVIRKSLIGESGKFEENMERDVLEYDLVLRLAEKIKEDKIRHIPHILYHERISETPVVVLNAMKAEREKYIKILQAHFDRMDQLVQLLPKEYSMHVRFNLPAKPPLVSIIIPTRDRLDLLQTCISGLFKATSYSNYEIIIIDNGSVEEATLQYFKMLQVEPRVKVLRIDEPFNWSRLNNLGVQLASDDLICLLNNDIEPINADWLSEMVALALQPNIGAVGAKLFYPDNTIQHAGVLFGMGELAGHPFRLNPGDSNGYFYYLKTLRSVSCVTGACLLMRRDIFDKVGGLDENLAVAFNDVDLCIRIIKAGYRILWTPHAKLYHYESASRGTDLHPAKRERANKETNYIKNKHPGIFTSDMFYNPNLDFYFPYRLAQKRRVTFPWAQN